jgi:hypothetical protein
VNKADQELVGRDVYSNDGHKVGEIKEIVPGEEYVVVRRSPFAKSVVPVKAMERSGERLMIAQALMYLDMAPSVGRKRGRSIKDKARLDEFFMHAEASAHARWRSPRPIGSHGNAQVVRTRRGATGDTVANASNGAHDAAVRTATDDHESGRRLDPRGLVVDDLVADGAGSVVEEVGFRLFERMAPRHRAGSSHARRHLKRRQSPDRALRRRAQRGKAAVWQADGSDLPVFAERPARDHGAGVKHRTSARCGVHELMDAAVVIEMPVTADESVGRLNGFAKSPGIPQEGARTAAVERDARIGCLDPERDPPLRKQPGRTLGVVDQDLDADVVAGHGAPFSTRHSERRGAVPWRFCSIGRAGRGVAHHQL